MVFTTKFRGPRCLPMLGAILVTIATIACSTEPTQQDMAREGNTSPTISIILPQPAIEGFDVNNFDRSIIIDNEWFPLKPGRRLVYEGESVENGESTPHRVVHIVTDLTKMIGGIRAVVVYELDISDDELEEAELAFFAQDDDGNVWHLGQYRENYEGEEFLGGRAWFYGHLDGAKPGIIMKAEPVVSASYYSQGFAPNPYFWSDVARVIETGQSVIVPQGSYDNVLVIEETSEAELEVGAFQLKYHAEGVGVVKVGWRGENQSQETLELVEDMELSPSEIAEIRKLALELENHAYVYGRTPAAE